MFMTYHVGYSFHVDIFAYVVAKPYTTACDSLKLLRLVLMRNLHKPLLA